MQLMAARGNADSSAGNKVFTRLKEELRADIAKEYERTLFIMQFLQLDELEI
jgi:hypothetical protein